MTVVNYLLPIKDNDYFIRLKISDGKLLSVSYEEENNPDKDYYDIRFDKSMPGQDKKIISQFEQYFKNPDINWQLTLTWPKITPFQRRVLNCLSEITLGTTKTYGQIAKELNSSARAVGNACRKNPFPIVIPCHRVVAQNGLGGYDGQTAGKRHMIKSYLLKHEQAID